MRYIQDFDIRFYELNSNGCIKESVLFHFLQEIAAAHAEKENFGYSFISKTNHAWFVLKYHVKIHKWQANIFKLRVKTWPRGIFKLTCPREFEVYSDDGELLASASSAWVLVDAQTKRIVRPLDVFPEFPEQTDIKALETDFPKIPDVERTSFSKVFEVRFDDIDINQHVNNASYITWAFDTLDADFRERYSAKEIEIHYKKETKLGENILCVVEYDKKSQTTIHILKNAQTDEQLCVLRVAWQKITTEVQHEANALSGAGV